jgi:hypothetical protein
MPSIDEEKDMLINTNSSDLDLNEYPVIEHNGNNFVFPTMHTNVLLLTHLLVKHGVLTITPDQYKWLKELFQSPQETLTAKHIASFNKLIENAEVDDNTKLTFLGDLFVGEGQNDYFTLAILNRLLKNKPYSTIPIGLDILMTRSDLEFLLQYQLDHTEQASSPITVLAKTKTPSQKSLATLLENGCVKKEDVAEMIHHLIPHFKVFSTASSQKELVLLSANAFNLDTISNIVQELNQIVPASNISPVDKTNPQSIQKAIVLINTTLLLAIENNTFLALMTSLMFQSQLRGDVSSLMSLLLGNNEAFQDTGRELGNLEYYKVYSDPRKTDPHDNVNNLYSTVGISAQENKGLFTSGIINHQIINYALTKHPTHPEKKVLTYHYSKQSGRFNLKKRIEFEVPGSLDDAEVIRRLRLIYSDGRPENFFSWITDPSARQDIKSELALLRNQRILYRQEPSFHLFKATRHHEDFFFGCPDATLSPLSEEELTDTQLSYPSQDDNASTSIMIAHVKNGLQIVSNYRYQPAKGISHQELDRRVMRAFAEANSRYPYNSIHTLFSKSYDPSKEKPVESQLGVSKVKDEKSVIVKRVPPNPKVGKKESATETAVQGNPKVEYHSFLV